MRRCLKWCCFCPVQEQSCPGAKFLCWLEGQRKECTKATIQSKLEGERARHTSLQAKKMNMPRASGGFREGSSERVHSGTSTRTATLSQPSPLPPLRFCPGGSFLKKGFHEILTPISIISSLQPLKQLGGFLRPSQ